MRLTPSQIEVIREGAAQLAGSAARVWLFGSRTRDDARGGDVDLMIEVSQALVEPALMSARIASRLSRAFEGRHVDVLLKAPNLQEQAIHRVAEKTGVPL